MCNFSPKLVAWIDGELAVTEAADVTADVERHVQSCPECQRRVQSYEEVSRLVVQYCEAAAMQPDAKPRRKPSRWVPALSGAVAAAAVLFFMLRPSSRKQIPVATPTAKVSPAPVLETAQSTLVHEKTGKVQRRHAIARPQTARPDWAFEPAIQIAIPGESMLPPGAVPEGITFIADLSVAPDGSVQGLRIEQ